jgi:aldose 1-epimerase
MPLFSTPTPRLFGRLPGGEPVEAYTLANASGASVDVITYGGIVTSLRMFDRLGRLNDVVLGFDSLAPYMDGHSYFGAIVGRVAGRITGGRFTLDGRLYELPRNDGSNHLHGGVTGFDKRLWIAQPFARSNGAASLRLTYRSLDAEEGYPGTVDVAVTYTLSAQNDFIVEAEAVTDRPTPLCLTQHSYFNLAGENADGIANHELKINADEFAPTDGEMTLLGQRVAVDGRSNNFNHPRRLGEAIPDLFQRHGDLYFVRRPSHSPRASVIAARLVEPTTGLGLEIHTTETCIQLYTGSALDGSHIGKSGRPYGQHAGICLECEGYPDAVNAPELDDIVLRPGEVRRNITVYSFFNF